MRKSAAFLLFALLCTPVLAAIPGCVLKIRVLAPQDGYIVPVTPEGYDNVFVTVNVTNASSNVPVNAQVLLIMDNGTNKSVPSYSLGNQSVSFADYREGTHTFRIRANYSNCIPDSVTQYYYYRKGTVRSAPDFNPLLAPLVALALIAVARVQKAKKGKTRKN